MFEIRTAADFMDRGRMRRRRRRAVARRRGVLPHVLRLFVEQGGPVSRAALAEAVSGLTAAQLDRELRRLDAQDNLVLQDGAVIFAYPFSARPNPFALRLANGEERYACCAIDALGIAAMLRQRIDVRSRCHHSGAPLAFAVDPSGPEPAAAATMAWVGERGADDRRACTGL